MQKDWERAQVVDCLPSTLEAPLYSPPKIGENKDVTQIQENIKGGSSMI
jgi:hypothetical protein